MNKSILNDYSERYRPSSIHCGLWKWFANPALFVPYLRSKGFDIIRHIYERPLLNWTSNIPTAIYLNVRAGFTKKHRKPKSFSIQRNRSR